MTVNEARALLTGRAFALGAEYLIGPAGHLADVSRTYVVGVHPAHRADAEAFLARSSGLSGR